MGDIQSETPESPLTETTTDPATTRHNIGAHLKKKHTLLQSHTHFNYHSASLCFNAAVHEKTSRSHPICTNMILCHKCHQNIFQQVFETIILSAICQTYSAANLFHLCHQKQYCKQPKTDARRPRIFIWFGGIYLMTTENILHGTRTTSAT